MPRGNTKFQNSWLSSIDFNGQAIRECQATHVLFGHALLNLHDDVCNVFSSQSVNTYLINK